MKPLVAVALSGGIDSLMAAKLLIEGGYPVTGIHFFTGYEASAASSPQETIKSISSRLGIKGYFLDLSKPFKKTVVDYFIKSYLSGLTPNPCMVCNPFIKFGKAMEFAKKLGASFFATGHYARTFADSNGVIHLLKGKDKLKDQSYFLARMTQTQLRNVLFPLGEMTKSKVIEMAAGFGMEALHKSESQDICFIKNQTYADFLSNQDKFVSSPGLISDLSGKIIGKHDGLHLFTVGQRRGINCPASEPYYVVRLDIKTNQLIVGFKSDLPVSSCKVSCINWISNSPPEFPARVLTRVRYRSRAVASTLVSINSRSIMVEFDEPQPAITPGQGSVFYDGDEILGGGWIDP